ncbi:hypothetical protein SSX86_008377 [Deinandra increscens subsp. villosa]|uniref:SWIM-type domain-containing protein n=1 Tax=Deinandra increscens subsp. villosa TaxID=3103831 RepID=A0AAP0DCG0_9ASTR
MDPDYIFREHMTQDEVNKIYLCSPSSHKQCEEDRIEELSGLEIVTIDKNRQILSLNQNDNEAGDKVNHVAENVISEADVEDDENEPDDDDFIPNHEDVIDDVEVDMRDFRFNVDENIELENQEANEQVENDPEILDNEEFDSGSASDEGETSHVKRTLRQYRKAHHNTDTFYIGQTFGSKEEFKKLVREHGVKTRRQIRVFKDESLRVRAVCWGTIPKFDDYAPSNDGGRCKKTNEVQPSNECVGSSNASKDEGPLVKNVGGRGKKSNPEDEGCPWAVLISRKEDTETWVLKTLVDEHTCHPTRKVKGCTATFLSTQIMEQIRDNPTIPVKAIQEHLQRMFEVEVSHMKAFRAKTIALEKINGDYNLQYGMLRDYVEELVKSNPGTTVKIEVEPSTDPTSNTRKFKRIYVCLGSLKKGFKAIGRDLLGLDGAFLKGPYPGQVLTAVGVDPNNSIYPLSYAIVEAETLNSWTWFLNCLGEDLGLEANSNFTFISDRQKGIIPALEKVFPCAEHRFCLRHINENMKQKFRGKAYKDALWKLATVTTTIQFEKAMDELKALNKDAQEWLSKIPPKQWSRSHFSGRAVSDVLLNNMCEVMNAKILGARDKPIITALEYIRDYCMKRIVTILNVIDKSQGLLTPYATKLIEKNKKDANRYRVSWNGEDHYQVIGTTDNQYVVNMDERTCACRGWELTGIPCRHAVAAIWNRAVFKNEGGMVESYVNPIYRMDRWKAVYSYKVYPINGSSLWPKSQVPIIIIPPTHHKPVGRPRKARKRSAIEMEEVTRTGKLSKKGSGGTCSKCKKKGHNSRTCKGQEQAG